MSSENTKYLIVVTGPTGIGKSSLSNRLQTWLDTQIISADSRQIYKEMCIGTAKPSKEEIINHKIKMVDCISIQDYYSTGRYEQDALNEIEIGFTKSNVQLLVGGTGLYIEAIKNGMDTFPDVSDEVLTRLNKDLEERGLTFLQNELKAKDQTYYNSVDLNNARRVVRALSVIRSSGQAYSSFLNKSDVKRPFQIVEFIISEEREIIYNRINKRVDIMMENGLLEEVQSLYPYKNLRSLNTVGYSELFDYLDHKSNLSEAVENIKMNTRRYAKRQLTWIRKHNQGFVLKPDEYEKAKTLIRETCGL